MDDIRKRLESYKKINDAAELIESSDEGDEDDDLNETVKPSDTKSKKVQVVDNQAKVSDTRPRGLEDDTSADKINDENENITDDNLVDDFRPNKTLAPAPATVVTSEISNNNNQ